MRSVCGSSGQFASRLVLKAGIPLWAAGLSLAGCSLQSAGSAHIQIQLPGNESANANALYPGVAGSTSGFAGLDVTGEPTGTPTGGPGNNNNGFPVPSSLSDFTCFGINVTGSGIPADPRMTCQDGESFGVYAGLIPNDGSGATVDLTIPTGAARQVTLIGIQSGVGCFAIDSFLNGPDPQADQGTGQPYVIGSSTVDLYTDTSISIQAGLDPNNLVTAFNNCNRPGQGNLYLSQDMFTVPVSGMENLDLSPYVQGGGAGDTYHFGNLSAQYGTVTPVNPLEFSYTPAPGFTGKDTVYLTLYDDTLKIWNDMGIGINVGAPPLPGEALAYYFADTGNNVIRGITNATGGTIYTVAGSGAQGFMGGEQPAMNAEFNNPESVTVGSSGNLYIADTSNHVIRELDIATGIVSTVAGDNTPGSAGDSNLATSAQLNSSSQVAVDSQGDLFIADTNNNRIREVSVSNQQISTVAGTGTGDFSGDGGYATSADLYLPQGIAVDVAGNLYIADTANNRIRMVNPEGMISTVAGDGTATFSGDNGLATSAELNSPEGLALDPSGNLYIADTYNNRIREVTTPSVTTEAMIKTVAGTGSAGNGGDGGLAIDAELNQPSTVTVDSAGDIFIVDTGNNEIRTVNPGGIINTVAGNGTAGNSGNGGPAISAELNLSHVSQ